MKKILGFMNSKGLQTTLFTAVLIIAASVANYAGEEESLVSR